MRLIFASSMHAIDGDPEAVLVFPEIRTWPKNLYGVSNFYSENVGKYFALTAGLPTICLRIGPCIPLDMNVQLSEHEMKAYINPDELNQLLVDCLESHIPYSIVHATSQNRRMRRDLTSSICALDYHPQTDRFEIDQFKAPTE